MKKGFTLIELLAVIIILGILMLIAIPSVTSYINASRKQSYISTVKNVIKATMTDVNGGELNLNNPDVTYFIDPKCLKLETPYVSPFGDFDKSYIAVKYNEKEDSYSYYWNGLDKAGYGIGLPTKYDDIDVDKILSNLTPDDVKMRTIANQHYAIVDENCQVGEIEESDIIYSPACGSEVTLKLTSTLDGLDFVYYGTPVVATAAVTGIDNCETTYKWTFQPKDSTEWRPIEEMDQFRSCDRNELHYIVTENNIKHTIRYTLNLPD